MWEYICPKCRKSVKQSTHQCPHCGEKFPSTIRVPPFFLKDPKKLEAYVHKHVFPRISEFERNYLTKYFTVLFSDGWETAQDFTTNWTGSISATCSVETNNPHHGIYNAKFAHSGGGYPAAYKTLGTSHAELYVRGYQKLSALPTNNLGADTFGIVNKNLNTDFGIVTVFNNAGTMSWRCAYRDVDGRQITFVAATINADQWYCIEIYLKCGSSDGVFTVWIDGVQILNVTGIHSLVPTVDTIEVGDDYYGFSNTFNHDIFIDCVVVGDGYIGPEAPAGGVLAQVM